MQFIKELTMHSEKFLAQKDPKVSTVGSGSVAFRYKQIYLNFTRNRYLPTTLLLSD